MLLKITVVLFLGISQISMAVGTENEFDMALQDFEAGRLETSIRKLEALAEEGHADSAFFLGAIYYNGDGTSVDFSSAMKWLKKASKGNHAGAQFLLGLMYAEGHGVQRNLDATVEWFDKATRK